MDANSAIRLRRAREDDQPAIRALVHAEHMNPHGLDWPRFHVAERAGQLLGAVQVRLHGDGAAELGSLVVRPQARGAGLAWRLVEAVLHDAPHPVHVITSPRLAARFADFAFAPLPLRDAPWSVRRNHLLGTVAGGLVSWLRLRRRRPLVVLRRAAPGD